MPSALRASRLAIAALLLLGHLAAAAQKEPPAGPPYRVGGAVTRPEKISGDPPTYTEVARRARIMGVVIVEAVIDEQGSVASTKVLKGLPMGLERQALAAVQTWKFKPATLEGRPVPVYYVLTLNFQLGTDLSFGPRFGALLQKHPDLAEPVRAKRYEEAAALLDRWAAERPKDSEIRLGRTYILMAQGRPDEAWEEAKAYDGPDAFELFYFLGLNARNQASSGLDSSARYNLVKMGLQSVDRALAARPDDLDSMATKRDLLLDMAMIRSDDDEVAQAARDEADRLQRRIDALEEGKGDLTVPEEVPGEQPPPS